MRQNSGTSPAIGAEIQVAWYARIGLVLMVGGLQLAVFYLTYFLYHVIPYPFYLDLETWLDNTIPYIRWTWILYYFGFVYITCWGAAGIWFMPRRVLERTMRIYVALVLTGGVLHLLIPSDSPWPLINDLSGIQAGFKSTWGIEPLAGFPSMHAAMVALPAFISLHVFRSVFTRAVSAILAAAVCISIITAKEHWAIDIPAGIFLGLGASWLWRRLVWIPWRAKSIAPFQSAANIEISSGIR